MDSIYESYVTHFYLSVAIEHALLRTNETGRVELTRYNAYTKPAIINAFANVVLFICLPLFGLLADRHGTRVILRGAALYVTVVTLPVYALLALRTTATTVIAQFVLAIGMAAFGAGMPVFMASLFPLHLRTSGIGIAYNLSQALFGGTTPIVCTALYLEGSAFFPAIWVVATAILAYLCLVLADWIIPSDQSELAVSNADKGKAEASAGIRVPVGDAVGPQQSALTTQKNPMESSLNAL